MTIHLVISVVLLAAVLGAAVARPGGLPEAVVAVPAALLAVGIGLVPVADAWAETGELAPTVGFLAAVLALGHLADLDGVFDWLGRRLGRASTGRPRRLFGLVMVAAAVTTAVLSLDATVVLLTPVVLVTARRAGLSARPHLYACGHLANSASTLLPVSNLTNLLAFGASGLSFLGFTALMALPWAVAVVVEYVLLGLWFRKQLRATAAADRDPLPRSYVRSDGTALTGIPAGATAEVELPGDDTTETTPSAATTPEPPAPRFALVTLAFTLVGFVVASLLGLEPVWPATAGALVLAVRALARRRITVLRLVRAASPQFCLFVFGVGVVVAAVGANGLTVGLGTLMPSAPTLGGLLAAAAVAAVLANVVNNLPAALLLLEVLGPGASPGLVLAVLLGVNIGPNLTYAGSLATLLWRRVLRSGGERVGLGEFTAVGAITVPATLAAAVLALWIVLPGS